MDVISVVDDDASVRLATIDLLNSHGFACEAYGSAEEYLGSLRTTRTSCLILDLNMPGLSGLELQRHLAQIGRAVPIIFITAFPQERTRAQAMGAGARCYLPKPYSDEQLVRCIRRALDARAAQ
jgi:FixJ family two-component response regulator